MSKSSFSLILILLLALGLRLQNLGAVEHNIDHAYPIWQALNTLHHGSLPVTAQGTSVLFANPALTGYLFVLPVGLTGSPVGAYLLVIGLNTLAVLLAYRSARLLGAELPVALTAAFLIAINPWIIEYSRTTWVQSLIPFFACLVFYLIVPMLLGTAVRPGLRLFGALLALTAMTQTYLLAFAAVLPFGLLLIAFRRRLIPLWRSLLAGLVVFVLATGVYAAGLIRDWPQTSARLAEFSQGQSRLSDEAWSHALRLVTGRDYAIARGTEAPIQDSTLRYNLSEIVHVVLLLMLVAGLIGALYTLGRQASGTTASQNQQAALILLIWLLVPVLMMSYVSRPVHPFYLLLTLPAGHILTARGVGWLLDTLSFRRRAVAVPLLLLIAAVPLAILHGLNTLRYAEATLATPGAHGLTALPLADGMALLRNVPTPAVLFADADEATLNSFAGRLFPVDRDVDTARIRYWLPERTLYLLDEPGDLPVESSYRLADGTAFYVVPPNTPATGDPIGSDSGLASVGTEPASLPAAGQVYTIESRWRVDALVEGRENWLYAPFVHVYDQRDQRVAIGDGRVVPGWKWRLGEVQTHIIRVEIPADAQCPCRVQIGLYDGVHSRNAVFNLPDGRQDVVIALREAR